MSPVQTVTYVCGLDIEKNGGEGGIRTHGTLSRTAVFKTAALNHSATSPKQLGCFGHCCSNTRFLCLEEKVKRGFSNQTPKLENSCGRRGLKGGFAGEGYFGMFRFRAPTGLGRAGRAQQHRNITKVGAAGPVSWAGF